MYAQQFRILLVKISNLREIRILKKKIVKNIRQIEGRSALLSKNVINFSPIIFVKIVIQNFCTLFMIMN